MNVRGLTSVPAAGRLSAEGAEPGKAVAGGGVTPPGSPAVSVRVSGSSAMSQAGEASDLELLSQLKAKVEAGEYRIDYAALSRALAEDWWLSADIEAAPKGDAR